MVLDTQLFECVAPWHVGHLVRYPVVQQLFQLRSLKPAIAWVGCASIGMTQVPARSAAPPMTLSGRRPAELAHIINLYSDDVTECSTGMKTVSATPPGRRTAHVA